MAISTIRNKFYFNFIGDYMKWQFNKIPGLHLEAYLFDTKKENDREENKIMGIKVILYSLGLIVVLILGILYFIYCMKGV